RPHSPAPGRTRGAPHLRAALQRRLLRGAAGAEAGGEEVNVDDQVAVWHAPTPAEAPQERCIHGPDVYCDSFAPMAVGPGRWLTQVEAQQAAMSRAAPCYICDGPAPIRLRVGSPPLCGLCLKRW